MSFAVVPSARKKKKSLSLFQFILILNYSVLNAIYIYENDNLL